MHRLTSNFIAAAVAGQLVGQLGWIDALFIPLVLIGPIVSGAVAAARGISFAWIAMLWCSAGIAMAWSDYVVNHEDVVFHLALAVLMPLLAGVGFAVVRVVSRVRRTPAA